MPRTTLTLPSPSPGTQRTLTVYRYGRPGARPKAYFQAALHADEFPALLVAQHLLRLLEAAEEAGTIDGEIVVVPVANPIGLGQHLHGHLLGRFDFEIGCNFNRQFPQLPSSAMLDRLLGRLSKDQQVNVARIRQIMLQTLAEQPRVRETDALKATLLSLSIDADLVFDLHCDSESLLHLYASRHHHEQAVILGAELGASPVLLEEQPGGATFDEANAGPWWRLREQLPGAETLPLACFSTTVEYRGQADVRDDYAEQDAARLYRYLQRCGVVAGDPGPLPELRCAPTPLEGVDVLVAPAAGLVVYRKALGDAVRRGEVVAELVDVLAPDPRAARQPIHSRTDGILFARMLEKLARPGQQLCKIAGAEPLPHRQLGQLLGD
ncbi:MAG: succinylglutamate desuccinylase/aspartoacylase family protein [Gammaproteobacteria bacterium]|nr:succinylglutamate desuccinylase/aspartoacylase family protein [Gammaproteobacteria bacterium]MCP5424276.1 succinylglutamate desuccinylase/aspartoacylase family protein [Gammaproteobacteria bacterium]